MVRTEIIATGHYVPERRLLNDDLKQWWDTSDEWITERTGIKQRFWVEGGQQAGSDLALEASRNALEAADMKASDIDCIVYATVSPDYFFPGGGVFLQRKLGIAGVPAMDVRTQCTGFLYGLSVADAWIRVGQYKRILLIGAEVHSTGMDFEHPVGRDLGVLFGDGAGAVILGPTEEAGHGILSTHLYADGRGAEALWCESDASARWPRISHEDLDAGRQYPYMNGREVFKNAVKRMPETVQAALAAHGLGIDQIDLLIAHQANLRINEMVQKQLGLRDDQVYNNIDRFGNTTAATLPIALDECMRSGRLERGDLLVLTAFGSGFTWGSAAIRW
ncbi:MAG TPA: beta-ketoacyl-ACP synthase III [Longimicrobiales bacterium]|nr:beta-ketoacyl-ACP synthase III [Longimicrobiales bacterium]